MSSYRPPSKPLDLDITILSAKHLHNCNWRQGDLKPYVSFWIEPNRRLTTKTDDSGSTRPIWNERFTLPINIPISDALLALEINHAGDNPPAPVVGSVQFPLELINSDTDSKPIQTLELRRPSGRPQGKIRVKLSIKERERIPLSPSPPPLDYHIAPPPNYYYSTAPPPPPRDYRAYSHSQPSYHSHIPPPAPVPAPAPAPSPSPYPYTSYSDPYSSYYPGGSGYYTQLPPPPRPYFDQGSNYGGGVGHSSPSAPVDYSSYDQRNKGNKAGLGTGLAVGAVAGSLGGLALDEGLKHEEDKIAERVEKDMDGRDSYGDYRGVY